MPLTMSTTQQTGRHSTMRQIIGPIAVMTGGILFGMFVPGDYNGHAISTIGWVVAAFAALVTLILVGFAIRQQNVDKQISSNMLSSNRTRVFMGDNRDHFQSDDMVDRN